MKTIVNFSLLFIIMFLIINQSNGQDTWTKRADFPGVARGYAAGFCIGNRGYIGGGDTTNNFNSGLPIKNDFWEYNPDSNKWTQKASIPGNPRFGAVSFSIGNKGFIGGGDAGNDFWEYNPANNKWSRKANIPGISRLYSVAFSIGGKAYAGMGFGWGTTKVLNDFWEYDTLSNHWTKKANFGGVPKCYAVSFAIGNKGFVGTGEDSTTFLSGSSPYHNDFWEYDTTKDKWTQKANIGYHGRSRGIGFSMANQGYIGFGYIDSTGIVNDMWSYDTTANQWTQMSYCDPGYSVFAPFAFSIGDFGFVGSGEDINGTFYNDLYQYNLHTSGISTPENKIDFNIYPNPSSGSFIINSSYPIESYEVCDMNGKQVYEAAVHSDGNSINVNLSLPNGLYMVRIISNSGTSVKKILVTNN